MGKKWKNGEFGINNKTVNVYHLMAEHFPKMFPRLTRLHKIFLFDEKMPQRPTQDERLTEVYDRDVDLWNILDDISKRGGSQIKIAFKKDYVGCYCDDEYHCQCQFYKEDKEKAELIFTVKRPSYEEEIAEWKRLHREREEQQAINKVNVPFNKKQVKEIEN